MRGFRHILPAVAALVLVAGGLAVAADIDVSITANLMPERLPFHHVARYEIMVEGPAGAGIEIAPWASEMPGLEVRREAARVRPVGTERQRFAQDFLLMPSFVQNYELPPLIVLLDGVPGAELPARRLEIRDLTSEELAMAIEPAPMLSLADIEGNWLLCLLSGIGVAVLLAIVFGFWWWCRSREMARSLPPWESADEELVGLIARLEKRRIRGEAYYVELSRILRDYVALRFQIVVHERTTPELAEHLVDGAAMEGERADALVDLLRSFDRVKFAQNRPTISEMTAEVERARDFVASTKPEALGEPIQVDDERQSA